MVPVPCRAAMGVILLCVWCVNVYDDLLPTIPSLLSRLPHFRFSVLGHGAFDFLWSVLALLLRRVQ